MESIAPDLYPTIASYLPLEKKQAFNLSTAEWLQVLDPEHVEFISNQLQLQPHALLFKRLADFLFLLNEYLDIEENTEFRFSLAEAKYSGIEWGEEGSDFPILVDLLEEAFAQDNYPYVYVKIFRLKNNSYLIAASPFVETFLDSYKMTRVIRQKDFPIILLSMIIFWNIELHYPDILQSSFDSLSKTVKVLRENN